MMEDKMETTVGFRVSGFSLQYFGGYIGDNGKQSGNYYVGFRVLGFKGLGLVLRL